MNYRCWQIRKVRVIAKRNFTGENIDEIRFHPAYWKLMDIAVKSEMFRVKWKPSLRTANLSTGVTGSTSLYAMSESGQYCRYD